MHDAGVMPASVHVGEQVCCTQGRRRAGIRACVCAGLWVLVGAMIMVCVLVVAIIFLYTYL